MDKLSFRSVAGLALVAMLGMTSCSKDFQPDIDGLDSRVTSLEGKYTQIENEIKGGKLITKVESVTEGLKITLNDGITYTITNGKDGINGKDGKDGVYYVPGEDGYWYLVSKDAEGKSVKTKTEDMWQTPGVLTGVLDENGVLTLFNVKGSVDAEGKPVGFKIGFIKLNNLIAVPDLTSMETGKTAFDFSSILFNEPETECAGKFTQENKNTEMKFRVSPSNATIDQIDLDNLSFMYKATKLRAEGKTAEVTSARLSEDGILTVKVELNKEWLESAQDRNADGTYDLLQLVVPSAEQKDGAVYSDWVSVLRTRYNSEELQPVRVVDAIKAQYENLQYKSLNGAKHGTVELLVDLNNKATWDLKSRLALKAREDLIDMESYQFDYVFDELDENGKQIVFDSNDVTSIDTDQNRYITVTKDGQLTITDYRGGTNSLRPALNRTPIVRVNLVTTNEAYTCNKVLDSYFVKLKIAEDIKPIDAIPAIKRSMEVYEICKGGELTIGTEEFNKELLSQLNLSMGEFARIFDHMEDVSEEDDKNPATVENVGNVDLKWDYQNTGTYNLKWTISAEEAKAYVGKVVTRTVALKSFSDPSKQIIFNFSAKIVAPKFDFVADGLIDKTLWVGGMIKHNSEVPGKGKTIDFDNSLFRSFVTVGDVAEFTKNNILFSKVVRTVNGVATKPYSSDNYQAEFAFTYNQPVLGSLKDGRKVTLVYNSSTSLNATLTNAQGTVVMRGEVAKLDAATGTLTFANTQIAQLLLNEDREFLKVRVQAKVKNTCANLYADVDGFAQVGQRYQRHQG